jgi:hypothetical protein
LLFISTARRRAIVVVKGIVPTTNIAVFRNAMRNISSLKSSMKFSSPTKLKLGFKPE